MSPAITASEASSVNAELALSAAGAVDDRPLSGTLLWLLVGLLYAIPLAVGVIPGAQIGARFTIATDDKTLRYTVGSALGVIAIVYAVGEISALF